VKHPNIDVNGGRFKHPLLAAIAKRNRDSIAALLGLPSSIYSERDITHGLFSNMEAIQDHTPFSWACEKGNLTIRLYASVISYLERTYQRGNNAGAKWS
jgi:hypothetical protein